jgi:hypothetical protein
MDLGWLNAIDPWLAGDGRAELAGDWQDTIGPGWHWDDPAELDLGWLSAGWR